MSVQVARSEIVSAEDEELSYQLHDKLTRRQRIKENRRRGKWPTIKSLALQPHFDRMMSERHYRIPVSVIFTRPKTLDRKRCHRGKTTIRTNWDRVFPNAVCRSASDLTVSES